MILWLSILAAFLLLAIVLTALGFRGRLSAVGPHCRRCKYSLAGHAVPITCPECGRDLTQPRAIREGLRTKRRLPLALGLILILAIGAVSVFLLSSAPIVTLLPAGVLTLIARVEPTERSVINELLVRETASALSRANLASLIPTGLAEQANLAHPWLPAWGDLLEAARRNGIMSDGDWSTYALQALPTVTIEAPDAVAAGDNLTFAITLASPRAALNSMFMCEVSVARTRLGGDEQDGRMTVTAGLGAGGKSGASYPVHAPETLGDSRLELDLDFNIKSIGGVASAAVFSHTYSAPVRIEPKGTVLHTLTPAPELAEQIRSLINIRPISINITAKKLIAQVTVDVDTNKLPINLATAVWLRFPSTDPGKPYTFSPGKYILAKGSGMMGGGGISNYAPDSIPLDVLKNLTAVDVIFKSSLDVLKESPTLRNAWEGEIIIHNVKVNVSPPTAAPATPATANP